MASGTDIRAPGEVRLRNCRHPGWPRASAPRRNFPAWFPTIVETAAGDADQRGCVGPAREAVTALRDVQSAVDELGASLAHPVLVEDARHRPIWWSAQRQVDGTRMRTILQHEVKASPQRDDLHMALRLAAFRLAAR